MNIESNEELLLSLDISTKTVGVSLFTVSGELLELTHVAPIIKPQPDSKTEELIKKAELVGEFLTKFAGLNIKHIAIEEPLLRSNNVNTVGTLLRFNGMVTLIVYNLFGGVVPDYISTYTSRSTAFPELMREGSVKGKLVLFGGFPKDIDKKHVMWELVSKKEKQIKWLYDNKGKLKKENYDMVDSYVVGTSYLKLNNFIK